jgi:RNA polymerase sigma factor (sigma-70 family)
MPPRTAFAQLEAIAPRLLGWAHLRLRGRSQADAEDLAQEVLCRAVARIERFREGDLAAWVFRIAHNVLLESLRRSRRNGRTVLSSGDSSSPVRFDERSARITTLTRKVAQRDDVLALLAFAKDLDEQDHKLVLLCGLEGLPTSEAALRIGLGEEATAKRWYRLRGKLRREFGGEE